MMVRYVGLAAAAMLLATGSLLTAEAESAERASVAQPDSPLAEALRARLDQAPDSPVEEFYSARGYAPLWLAPEGTPTDAAQALLDWAGEAKQHALPEERYRTDTLAGQLGNTPAPRDAARLELEFTRLFLAYARDLSSGLLEPREIKWAIDITPPNPAPGLLLARAAAAPDLPAFLAGLAPSDPDYQRLLGLYREMREIVRQGGWGSAIAGGPTLRLGDRGPRVAAVRARLIALGDLPAAEQVATNEVMNDAMPTSSDPMLFDPALEAAVLRFQARHGLNTDGAVGPMTLAALNTPAEKRAEQAAVNLERLRWLNRDKGPRYVVINTAAFSMSLIEDGAARFTTRTVVGKAHRHETPEFVDELEYIVVNPTWNVPRSIATEEILPELRKDPTYLERNNMELLGADRPASMIDWSSVTPRSFPWRIRQRPGPDNALGEVKFLFPNKYSIYMHDTPARRLFQRDRRDFSHGCVRLQDPVEFAHLLLSYQTQDAPALYDRLRAMPGERWVRLEQPIPVYVTYRTAWVAPDGTWQFRSDVYHRDAKVAASLEEAGVSIPGT